MTEKAFIVRSLYCVIAGTLMAQSFMIVPAHAQYYPPSSGYMTQPTYNPYSGYPPQTSNPYGYPPSGSSPYGYSSYGGYSSPPASYTYPPSSTPYGYPPPPDTTYGYPPTGSAPPSPFSSGEAPSFGSAPTFPPMDGSGTMGATMYPPPGATGMMAWSPTTPINGIKFNYDPQAGDYLSMQTRNSGRWEQFPVTLHLTFPEGASDNQKSEIKSAVTAWQKYVDIVLVEHPEQAKIELTWASNLGDEEDLGETNFKGTHLDSMGRTIFDKAIIRMQDPKEYKNIHSDTLKSAVMHQLGHALGISGHSDNYRDLMGPPAFKRTKNPIVAKAVRSLASRTLGQFIDLPDPDDDSDERRASAPIEKISKRDLNTLFRLYN